MLRSVLTLLLATALPSCLGFSGNLPSSVLPLRASGAACKGFRRSSPATAIKMEVDATVVTGVLAGMGGIGAAVGILALIEQQGVKSAARMDEALRNKLELKIDGGEAKNQFGGTDQTIEDLIANMEAAQGGGSKPKETKKKAATAVEEDDGW